MGKRKQEGNNQKHEEKKIKLNEKNTTKDTTMKRKIIKIANLKINTICDTVRARIIHKSDIKEWKNERGTGKKFTIDISDESDKIRCSFFGEAANKYHGLIERNKIYTIIGGLVRKVNELYPSINNKEIMIPVESSIKLEDEDENENIPKINFEFRNIEEIVHLPNNSFTDIIAIITKIKEVEFIYSMTGRLLRKRTISLADDSDYEIELNMWNEEAESFEGKKGDVIALKELKINEYKKIKNLTTTSRTTKTLNPNSTEGKKIKSWYNKINKNKEFKKVEECDSGNEDDPLEGTSKMNEN